MGLNETPRSERVHIAIFGRRNAGKSSLINALTGQDVAVVSPVKGTTTDPVYKAMEILPLGPVVLIDTPGLDDEGELGELRMKKAQEVLNKSDMAIVVLDREAGVTGLERSIAKRLKDNKVTTVGVLNKVDEFPADAAVLKEFEEDLGMPVHAVSAASGQGVRELRQAIAVMVPENNEKQGLLGDLITPGEFVVLVVPIDSAAPKGRLILPQQQAIRDILDNDAMAVVTKENDLKATLNNLGRKPKLVITDSQAFKKVAADTPEDIPLTSFSILLARSKGNLPELVRGAKAVGMLKDGDKILIAEACTHHQQEDDIGRVKIPCWLRQTTGKQLEFEHSAGYQFPEDIGKYALIVHCGGCMINKKAMSCRLEQAMRAEIPVVNYGVLIAYMTGILERAISPFPSATEAWEKTMEDNELVVL